METLMPIRPRTSRGNYADQKTLRDAYREYGPRYRNSVEEKGTTRPHHNTTYLMDEDGLYYGTAFFAAGYISKTPSCPNQSAITSLAVSVSASSFITESYSSFR